MMNQVLEQRSDLSRAFEVYWRSLPCAGALPDYRSFDPLKIPDLVPYLMIFEVVQAPERSMLIKMSGSVSRDRTGLNLSGYDVRELFDEASADSIWASAQIVIGTPCGLLQLNNTHYKNASDNVTELTLFPTAARDDDQFTLVAIAHTVGYHSDLPQHAGEYAIRVQPSERYAWIDIGGGLPDL